MAIKRGGVSFTTHKNLLSSMVALVDGLGQDIGYGRKAKEAAKSEQVYMAIWVARKGFQFHISVSKA